MAIDFFADLASDFEASMTPVDPVAWAWDKAGIELWSKQRDITYSVRDNKKTACKSAHGTGKSLVASVIAAWWIDIHPPDDTFVITTAPSKDQVSGILWENIRQIHRNADLDGRVTLDDKWRAIDDTLVGQGRKPADYAQSTFQGIHAKYVLFILDESCGIPQWIWTAAIANTSTDECRVLAIGNPDDPGSEFARVCDQDPSWNTIRISVWDAPNFSGEKVGRSVLEHTVQQSYVDDARSAWGEGSALWTSKIEGLFPSENEFSVIPHTWVALANERWNTFMDMPASDQPQRKILGVDVARFGTDKTVIAHRLGNVFTRFDEFAKLDTIQVARKVAERMNKRLDKAIIDLGGDSGAGVYDLLKKWGYHVEAFQPGAKTDKKDETGKLEFTRVRSAAWWKVRDALDPNKEPVMAFPKVINKKTEKDILESDLTAPGWEMVLNDKIQVESKDDIRKRLSRSTDSADALIMAWWARPHVLDDLEEEAFNWNSNPGKHEDFDSFNWDLEEVD